MHKYRGPLSQNFKADLSVERESVTGAVGGAELSTFFNLTIDMLRGEVDTLSWDPASKEFKTKEYQELDFAGLTIARAIGYKAVLRVETRDGDRAAFEVLGVKEEDGKGKLKMAVKPIGKYRLDMSLSLKKANVDINVIGDMVLSDPQDRAWFSDAIRAFYDSSKGTLTIKNNDNDGSHWVTTFAAAMERGTPLDFWFSSSSGEGEVIEAVAKVQWVKADGEGLKVRLSNKELNGVGMTAKKAKDALDRLNSGSYIVRVGRVAGAFDIEGRGFGGLIPLDVEDGALLKKTRMLGEVELQFKTNDRDRILYINKDDKHTIRSKPVKSYLVELAEKYDEPFRDDSSENGWWWESKQSAIFAMKTERGESVIGMLTGLRWDVKKKVWQGTASLGFAEAERLQKKSTLIDQIWIWDWL